MSRKGLVQPLALAAILALGFAVVWGVLGLWLAQVGEYLAEREAEHEGLFFRPDGTPLIESWTGNPNKARRYTDLERHPEIHPAEGDDADLLPTTFPTKLPARSAWGEVSWDERIRSMPDGRPQPVYWHFVSDGRPDGTAYFVGYDSESKVCVGYLGTAGFREAPLPLEELIPFEGVASGPRSRVIFINYGLRYRRRGGMARAPRGFVSPWDVYVLGRAGELYHADLQNRSIQIIRANAPIRSAALLSGVSDPVLGTLHRLAIRTDDSLSLMDEKGQVLRRFPIPEPARERTLSIAETSLGEVVMYWEDKRERSTGKVDHWIYWVSPDGVRREAQIALTSDGPDGVIVSSKDAGIVLPSPLLLGGLLAFFVAPNELERAAGYPQALGQTLMEFRSGLVIAQLLGVLLAVLCYRRQVRYGASRTERIAWPLFVLLLGLPGWIGYRFGRRWPVLETCPVCGAIVPRDRSECARCASAFPLPELKGTEVFA
jgi:hypothetical protein